MPAPLPWLNGAHVVLSKPKPNPAETPRRAAERLDAEVVDELLVEANTAEPVAERRLTVSVSLDGGNTYSAPVPIEPRPDAGEPKRFRVIARDRTSLGEYVGIEDALRANRTTPGTWQVIRISDGAPMTVPLRSGGEVGHFENLADSIAERAL